MEKAFLASGGAFREVKIQHYFEKIKTKSLPYSANDLKGKFDDTYSLPALTAGVDNQGLAFYVPRENATILKNVISVSANGANTGVMYYQPKEFTVLQDSYAIRFKNKEPSSNVYLYLVSALQKSIRFRFDWSNKAGWERIKNEPVTLPFEKDEIAFGFMENFVYELQASRLRELQNYLKATGLSDYRLTEEEKRAVEALDKVEWGNFVIGNLFNVATGRDVIIGKVESGSIPLISHQHENNGITKYIKRLENRRLFEFETTISLADRGVFYATTQNQNFHIGTRVKALIFKCGKKSKNIRLFIVSAINKLQVLFTAYSDNATDKLPSLEIKLAIKNGEIDFEYMEVLIRAVQKLVIADVVKYADREMAAYQQIVQ